MKLNKELIDKISNHLDKTICTLINLLGWVMVYLFLILGSGASLILLYKLFPETAINYFRIMFPMFIFFSKVMICLFIILGIPLIIVILISFFIEIKEKQKKRKEEFINEIVKKIKGNK